MRGGWSGLYGGKTYKVFGKNAVNKLILYIETRIKKKKSTTYGSTRRTAKSKVGCADGVTSWGHLSVGTHNRKRTSNTIALREASIRRSQRSNSEAVLFRGTLPRRYSIRRSQRGNNSVPVL